MNRGYTFVLAALAVWRITYALTAESGPARTLARLRIVVARWGSVLDCFYCASVWIALPIALAIGTTAAERALLWPALSGAACLAHRLSDRGQAAIYWEEPEDDHVLRRNADESRTTPRPH